MSNDSPCSRKYDIHLSDNDPSDQNSFFVLGVLFLACAGVALEGVLCETGQERDVAVVRCEVMTCRKTGRCPWTCFSPCKSDV